MKKMDFKLFLQNKVQERKAIFFDGGMGTMIQKHSGIKYSIPEDLNFYNEEIIKNIHLEYLKSGVNVLTANSFGANPIKLSAGEGSHTAVEYIKKSIQIQKEVIEEFENSNHEYSQREHFSSWDSGQIGKLLEPMGEITFDQAYESYKECAIAAEEAGADLAIIETMSDLYEVKACILAIKENTKLPIVASMTFQENLRTLTGADVLTCVSYLEALNPDIIGFNCGGSLEEDLKLSEEFCKYASLPVLAQPNAGLPVVENGKTIFKVDAKEFASYQEKNLEWGVSIFGGCCGTTPEHIKEAIKILENKNLIQKKEKTETYICSYNKTVQIGKEAGPKIIGERINPTGKKKCKEALLQNDMNFILSEAESQITSGAHILDVNVGLPGIDEKEMMLKSIKAIQKTFNTPLQIDSSEAEVLEKSLRYYNGKALINSVNGKQESMDKIFPLVKKYGGSVVALCLDENGISQTAEGRVEVAEKIIKEAKKYGIKTKDIFIDTLTLTISSEQKTAMETIRAIEILKEKYDEEGLQFVLGVSNISFGLPRRDIINSRFFLLALNAGLSACIINPGAQVMMETYNAFRTLKCFDTNCLEYIETYTGTLDPHSQKYKDEIIQNAIETKSFEAKKISHEITNSNSERKVSENPLEQELIQIIEKGFTDKAAEKTETLLKTHQAEEIINNCIVPALDNVGKDFETGKKFLPQLLLSAQTVSEAFAKIKQNLEENKIQQKEKGTIAVATVYGDIHDIGKNIVRAMLENYAYKVIDLGKNVAPELIIKTVLENKIKLLGLSALMTTTVSNMELTIKQLKLALKENNWDCKIVVGGAVLSPEYSQKIGADFYAKDAMETVNVAKKIFGN